MAKHAKNPAAEGKAFDKQYANSQSRVAAKGGKVPDLPPKGKPASGSVGIPQNGPSTGEPSE
jgi:hypothetical protein